jgi:hypothetical protein
MVSTDYVIDAQPSRLQRLSFFYKGYHNPTVFFVFALTMIIALLNTSSVVVFRSRLICVGRKPVRCRKDMSARFV